MGVILESTLYYLFSQMDNTNLLTEWEDWDCQQYPVNYQLNPDTFASTLANPKLASSQFPLVFYKGKEVEYGF